MLNPESVMLNLVQNLHSEPERSEGEESNLKQEDTVRIK
jgi:hypothetical protein